MKYKAMPSAIRKNDSFFGTIVSSNRNGINIRLDVGDPARDVRAFAYSGGEIGRRVLVSVIKFNERFNQYNVAVDSFLHEDASYATMPTAA